MALKEMAYFFLKCENPKERIKILVEIKAEHYCGWPGNYFLPNVSTKLSSCKFSPRFFLLLTIGFITETKGRRVRVGGPPGHSFLTFQSTWSPVSPTNRHTSLLNQTHDWGSASSILALCSSTWSKIPILKWETLPILFTVLLSKLGRPQPTKRSKWL